MNLTTADEGRDAKGSRVKILVGADGDADLAADARVGAAGDELYVKVIFAKPSKRNAPLPTVTGLGDSKTIDQLTTGKVTLGPGGASAAFEVELGLAGGTGCTVSVGVTPEANDQTLSLVTWRRLFYQATRPGTMALPSLARMTTALEELFVRYEKHSEVVFTEGDGPAPGPARSTAGSRSPPTPTSPPSAPSSTACSRTACATSTARSPGGPPRTSRGCSPWAPTRPPSTTTRSPT